MNNRTTLALSVFGLLCVLLACDANAMLHTRMGRFMQRDPAGTALAPVGYGDVRLARSFTPTLFMQRDTQSETLVDSAWTESHSSVAVQKGHKTEISQVQYTDGMNLYLPYRASPIRHSDPTGLYVHNKSDISHWVYISGAGGGWQRIQPGAKVFGDTDLAAPNVNYRWGNTAPYDGYKVIDCMDIVISGQSPGPMTFEAVYSEMNLLFGRGNTFARKCICSSSTAAWAIQYAKGGRVPIANVAGGNNNPPDYP